MKPTTFGADDHFSHLCTDGDSVPWTPHEILTEARSDSRRSACVPVPFVVQIGPLLIMVEGEPEGWTLAELRFHTRTCDFQEVRRVTYTWPREAFGAMLSHLAAADPPEEDVLRLTREFGDWLGTRFARCSRGGSPPC